MCLAQTFIDLHEQLNLTGLAQTFIDLDEELNLTGQPSPEKLW